MTAVPRRPLEVASRRAVQDAKLAIRDVYDAIKSDATVAARVSKADRHSHVAGLQFERKRCRIRDGSRRTIRLLALVDFARAVGRADQGYRPPGRTRGGGRTACGGGCLMSGRNPLSRIHRKSGVAVVFSLFVLASSAAPSVSQTLDGGWTGSFHSSGISVDASLVFVGECNRVQCLAIGAIFLPRGDTLTVNFAGSYDGRTIELNDLDSTATLEGTVRSNRAAMTLHYTGTDFPSSYFRLRRTGMRIPTKPSSGFIIVSSIVVLLCAGYVGAFMIGRNLESRRVARRKRILRQRRRIEARRAHRPSAK